MTACRGRGQCKCKEMSAPVVSTAPAPVEDYCSCPPGSTEARLVVDTPFCNACDKALGPPWPHPMYETPDRHPNSARFHELLKEAGELHDRKQGDYGKGDDPFANVRASDEWGVDGWKGAMIRLTDKVRRLQSLATKGHLNNEAVYDSFIDISVYALIAYVLYEQQHEDV